MTEIIYRKKQLVIVFIISSLILSTLNIKCEKTDKINNIDENTNLPINDNFLMIADFESGKDPTNQQGIVQSWNNEGKPHVEYKYKQGDGANSNYSIGVTLTGNDGNGNGGWTGGGLVLILTEEKICMDLEDYIHVEFDIKMTVGSDLAETKIKLEDTLSSEKPERLVSDYGVNINDTWQRVSIPIEDFIILKENDPIWWDALNVKCVSKFITVSVNDGKTNNGDGTLLLDNVQFVK